MLAYKEMIKNINHLKDQENRNQTSQKQLADSPISEMHSRNHKKQKHLASEDNPFTKVQSKDRSGEIRKHVEESDGYDNSMDKLTRSNIE